MALSQEQIRQFHEEGWLFLPETFSPEEVAALREESEAIYGEQRPEVQMPPQGTPPQRVRASAWWQRASMWVPVCSPVRKLFQYQAGPLSS